MKSLDKLYSKFIERNKIYCSPKSKRTYYTVHRNNLMPFHKIITQALQKLHIPWRHIRCQPIEQMLLSLPYPLMR